MSGTTLGIFRCFLIHHCVFVFAQNMCLVDGKKSIAVQVIADDQELVHFNCLWCHLFYVLSSAKGMTFF
jgi:hypothetical protein